MLPLFYTKKDLITEMFGGFKDRVEFPSDNTTHPIDIEFEVPGFSKSDFKIDLTGKYLTISAQTDKRKFFRVITIDTDRYNTEKISATLENGILHLIVPLLETKKSKSVTIEIK